MNIPENLYKKLLLCNLNNINLCEEIGMEKINDQIQLYKNLTDSHTNYLTESPELSDWYNDGYTYPNVNSCMQTVLDLIKKYKPKIVLEAGAGSGKLSKYVYDILDKDVELICVENNKDYYQQMQTNFTLQLYEPKIHVNAQTILSSIHNIESIKDKSVEMVFTHTVLMHLPFTAAVEVINELARISSKYVLHKENLNDIVSNVYPRNVYPECNKLMIDYKKIYNELGFKTVFYQETILSDGNTGITYLGERV